MNNLLIWLRCGGTVLLVVCCVPAIIAWFVFRIVLGNVLDEIKDKWRK